MALDQSAIERIPIEPHYAYVLVPSKTRMLVFEPAINAGYVAFIDRIACDWFEGSNPPATHSVIEMKVDGWTRVFDYEIQINKPYVFDPPLVARNAIQWWVQNNDVPYTDSSGEAKTGAHYYGILCDGCWARPKV